MLTLNKTKAALQSCQCHYEKPKQIKHTRVNAGGQSLNRAQEYALQRNQIVKKNITSNEQCSLFDALFLNKFNAFYQPFLNYKICAIYGKRPNTFITVFGKVNTKGNWITLISISIVYHFKWKEIIFNNFNCLITGNLSHCNFYSVVDFFDSLRWRRLISPFAAVTRNPAVLSPSCLKSSISSITSWGIRTVVICDFAFFAPVAITETPYVRCMSVYAKKIKEKGLKCISLWASLNTGGDIHLSSAKPGSARNTNRASDHKPLSEVTVMADNQSTQTRPKFTWRFLSTSERYPTAKPLVIYVNASSEQEARDTMPGVTLVFAARLPFHAFQSMEVRHA